MTRIYTDNNFDSYVDTLLTAQALATQMNDDFQFVLVPVDKGNLPHTDFYIISKKHVVAWEERNNED